MSTECHVSFTLLAHAQICTDLLCWHTFKVAQAFYVVTGRQDEGAYEFIANKIK